MNIKYQDALRLNAFMSVLKPKGQITGSSILKIISMKNELSTLQENYYKAFGQVMSDNGIEMNDQGGYSWGIEEKHINKKIEELLATEAKINSSQFMTEEEFVTIVDGTVVLEDVAFVQEFLMVSTKKTDKSDPKKDKNK